MASMPTYMKLLGLRDEDKKFQSILKSNLQYLSAL